MNLEEQYKLIGSTEAQKQLRAKFEQIVQKHKGKRSLQKFIEDVYMELFYIAHSRNSIEEEPWVYAMTPLVVRPRRKKKGSRK